MQTSYNFHGIKEQGSPNDSIVHFDGADMRMWNIGCLDNRSASCGHGSYHMRLTQDKKRVTCPECLKKLPS